MTSGSEGSLSLKRDASALPTVTVGGGLSRRREATELTAHPLIAGPPSRL